MEKKLFLSLDQSLSITGFAQINPSKRLAAIGEIRTNRRLSDVERWMFIETQLAPLTEGCAHVFLEGVFYSPKTIKSALKLVAVNTILERFFYLQNIPISRYSAHPQHRDSWRSTLSIGRTKRATQDLFGVSSSHAADAIAIGYCGLIKEYGFTLDELLSYTILPWNIRPSVA